MDPIEPRPSGASATTGRDGETSGNNGDTNDTNRPNSESVRAGAAAAGSEVRDLAGEAASQMADMLSDVREQVRERAQDEAHRAAGALSQIGEQLQTMAAAGDQSGPASQWVREVGDRSQRLADHLEQAGPQGLVDDVQRFARRRPGLFLAGASFAGFVVGRALKSGRAGAGSGSRGTEIDLRDRGPRTSPPGSVQSTRPLVLETPDNVAENLPTGVRADG